jgi:predicted  nucleic acid-binding Zn-ribbon protein
MHQENQEANDVLMDTVIQKLQEQGQKIQVQENKIVSIEQTIGNLPNYSMDLQQIKTILTDLKTDVVNLQFPTEKVQKFSKKLTLAVDALRQPAESKVLHLHHVPKILWITAVLFIILCISCSGWYVTAGKLDQYRSADTKYRYLYQKGDNTMRQILYTIDSLYHSGYPMRDSVVQWEADFEKASQLKQELQEKVGEGAELKSQLDLLEEQERARRGGN